MAHYEHSLVYVRVLKNIRIQDIGPVHKGDTAALTPDAADRLLRYRDVELLTGKALGQVKGAAKAKAKAAAREPDAAES